MYAQLTYFDGPRDDAQVAAFERADFDRIAPAIAADPSTAGGLVANFILRAKDGGQVYVTVVDSEETLRKGVDVIMSTELLPGEDPALLSGPDRVEFFTLVGMADAAHPQTTRV